MKGQKIFNETVKQLSLIETPEADGAAEAVRKNGRDAELIVLRNEHIMHKYYFYCSYTDKRWDVVVELLSQEFYLAEYTISKIITENSVINRKLLNEKPTVVKLRERYPLAKF